LVIQVKETKAAGGLFHPGFLQGYRFFSREQVTSLTATPCLVETLAHN
jgi:hypothetical protein